MYREIAGTDERVRPIAGVRDRRVRATKVRLYVAKQARLSITWARCYKTFLVLTSIEHEVVHAHKC